MRITSQMGMFLTVFLWSLLVLAVFDLTEAMRAGKKRHKILDFALDFLFFSAAGVGFLWLLIACYSGMMRGFLLLGVLLATAVYLLWMHRMVFGFWKILLQMCCSILWFPLRILKRVGKMIC